LTRSAAWLLDGFFFAAHAAGLLVSGHLPPSLLPWLLPPGLWLLLWVYRSSIRRSLGPAHTPLTVQARLPRLAAVARVLWWFVAPVLVAFPLVMVAACVELSSDAWSLDSLASEAKVGVAAVGLFLSGYAVVALAASPSAQAPRRPPAWVLQRVALPLASLLVGVGGGLLAAALAAAVSDPAVRLTFTLWVYLPLRYLVTRIEGATRWSLLRLAGTSVLAAGTQLWALAESSVPLA